MNTKTLVLYFPVFFLSLWLGYYLIARNLRKPLLLLTGYGLGFYAAAIMFEVLQTTAPKQISQVLIFFPNVFLYIPALLWTGTLIQLLPEETEQKYSFFRIWLWVVLPLSSLAVLANGLFGFSSLILTLIVVLPLVGTCVFLLSNHPIDKKFPQSLTLIATIFIVLVISLALPFIWLPRWLVLISIGLPLILLGIRIAIFDNSNQSQRLWADILRSLVAAIFLALLFGIQLALVIVLDGQLTFGMIVLTFSILATITFLATFEDHLQRWFNKVFSPKS